MGKLRWKKEKAETGLRAVGAGPRGYVYHDGETEFASVSAIGGDWRSPDIKGWYWCCGSNERFGIEWRNTASGIPYLTPDDAKRDAAAYINFCMSRAIG
jgi:hypothetical protein